MIPRLGFGPFSSSSVAESFSAPEALLDEDLCPLSRVLRLLHSSNPTQRCVAGRELGQLSVLQEIGWEAVIERVIPAIPERLTTDRDQSSRSSLLSAFGVLGEFLLQHGGQQGAAALRDILLEEVRSAVSSIDSPPEVRRSAAEALVAITALIPSSERRDTILPLPLAMAHDPDHAKTRAFSLQLLAELSELLGEDVCLQFCVPQVSCLSEDAEPEVRQEAVGALADLCRVVSNEAAQTRLLPPFLRCCEDVEAAVRRTACEHLLCIADVLPPAALSEFLMPKLRQLLQDASPSVQDTASAVLGPFLVFLVQKERLPLDLIEAFLHLSLPRISAAPPATASFASLSHDKNWLQGVFRSRNCLAVPTGGGLWSPREDCLSLPRDWRDKNPLAVSGIYSGVPRSNPVFCAFSVAAVLTTLCGRGPQLFQRLRRQRRRNGDMASTFPRWKEPWSSEAEDLQSLHSADDVVQPHCFRPRRLDAGSASSSSSVSSSDDSEQRLTPSRDSSDAASMLSAPTVGGEEEDDEAAAAAADLASVQSLSAYQWWRLYFRRPVFALLREQQCGVAVACRKALATSLPLLAEALLSGRTMQQPKRGLARRRASESREFSKGEKSMAAVGGQFWLRRTELMEDINDIVLDLLKDSHVEIQSLTVVHLEAILGHLTARAREVLLLALKMALQTNRLHTVNNHSVTPDSRAADNVVLDEGNSAEVQQLSDFVGVEKIRVPSASGPLTLINKLRSLPLFLKSNNPLGNGGAGLNSTPAMAAATATTTSTTTTTTNTTASFFNPAGDVTERDPQRLPSWRFRLHAAEQFGKILEKSSRSPRLQSIALSIFSLLLADSAATVRTTVTQHLAGAFEVFSPAVILLASSSKSFALPEAGGGICLVSGSQIRKLPTAVRRRLQELQPTEVSSTCASQDDNNNNNNSNKFYTINNQLEGSSNNGEKSLQFQLRRINELKEDLALIRLIQSFAVSRQSHLRIVYIRCFGLIYEANLSWSLFVLTNFLFNDFLALSEDPVRVVQARWAACAGAILRSRQGVLWRSQALRDAASRLLEEAQQATQSGEGSTWSTLRDIVSDLSVDFTEIDNSALRELDYSVTSLSVPAPPIRREGSSESSSEPRQRARTEGAVVVERTTTTTPVLRPLKSLNARDLFDDEEELANNGSKGELGA